MDSRLEELNDYEIRDYVILMKEKRMSNKRKNKEGEEDNETDMYSW